MKRLLSNPLIPWRIRESAHNYLEHSLYFDSPAVYRFLYLGPNASSPVAVTKGPQHHFFGYYDKSPWSDDFAQMLMHRSSIGFRVPGEVDEISIGFVKLESRDYIECGTSRAWNYQQGAMLQWDPLHPGHFVFNDRIDGVFISRLFDTNANELERYNSPIYAMHPTEGLGFSLNFSRLATLRPDYGYSGVPDVFERDPAPHEDGVFSVDLATGDDDLIVSLSHLAEISPAPSMERAFHWVNHIQPSVNGNRIAFLHRWRGEGEKHQSRLYTCKSSGADLRCCLDTGMVSHYDWINDNQLIAWAGGKSGESYKIVDILGGIQNDITRFVGDGHCSVSPNRRWILSDTYPDRFRKQELFVFEAVAPDNGKSLARLWSCDEAQKLIRCDLHPRWRQDGRQICFDSTHESTRQVYVLDLPETLWS